MSFLIFQLVIKQWDKGQNTPSHITARAAIPDRYTIATKPAYYVLDKPCIVDQHGDDIATSAFKNGRIKYGMLPDGRISFDRFQVSGSPQGDVLEYLSAGNKSKIIGPLNQGWIQCHYNWRYAVEEGGANYWMYEEVILNAACTDEFDAEYFLKSGPLLVFKDE